MKQSKVRVGLIEARNSEMDFMKERAYLLFPFQIPIEMKVWSVQKSKNQVFKNVNFALSSNLNSTNTTSERWTPIPDKIDAAFCFRVKGECHTTQSSHNEWRSLKSDPQKQTTISVETLICRKKAQVEVWVARMRTRTLEENQKKLSVYPNSLHQKVLEQAKEIHSFVYPNQIPCPFAGLNE